MAALKFHAFPCCYVAAFQCLCLPSLLSVLLYAVTTAVPQMHIAASRGHVDIANALIDYDVEVNEVNYDGRTPLGEARLAAQDGIVKLFQRRYVLFEVDAEGNEIIEDEEEEVEEGTAPATATPTGDQSFADVEEEGGSVTAAREARESLVSRDGAGGGRERMREARNKRESLRMQREQRRQQRQSVALPVQASRKKLRKRGGQRKSMDDNLEARVCGRYFRCLFCVCSMPHGCCSSFLLLSHYPSSLQDWQERVDFSDGSTYWYNVVTQQRSNTLPDALGGAWQHTFDGKEFYWVNKLTGEKRTTDPLTVSPALILLHGCTPYGFPCPSTPCHAIPSFYSCRCHLYSVVVRRPRKFFDLKCSCSRERATLRSLITNASGPTCRKPYSKPASLTRLSGRSSG